MKIVFLFIFTLVLFLLISGCARTPTSSSNPAFEQLQEQFDKNIDKQGFCIDPESGYAVHIAAANGSSWPHVIVGGTLINIKLNQNDSNYFLTFKGKSKIGELYLLLDKNPARKFEVGKFYKFDLMNNCRYFFVVIQSATPLTIPKFIEPELLN